MRQAQRKLPIRARSDRPRIRRRVFRAQLEPTADRTYVFTAHSFTRHNRTYTCLVNPESKEVHCTCVGFARLKIKPTYYAGRLCKHLARAVRTVRALEREFRPE